MRLCVIPARGGSKRIPKKNIKDFCGKPIIAYSIEKALQSGLFDRVIVSTDDEEIADVAIEYGAETPFVRPKELANDYAGTSAVVKHAIRWYAAKEQSISMVCCIYATAPFLQVKYLTEGYEKLAGSDKSFAFSVTSFPFPIQRAVKINKLGEIEVFYPENIEVRSQDLEDAYHDAGQFYWRFPSAFLQDQVVFFHLVAACDTAKISGAGYRYH